MIKEFKTGYTIDINGNVFSKKRNRILKTGSIPSGYMFIRFSNSIHYIHRLVAEAFIHNPDGKPQVNHIDGDKTNNTVDNLEWVTASENMRHAIDIGLKVYRTGKDHHSTGKTGSKCHNAKNVIGINLDGHKVEFDSAIEAAKHFGLTKGAIPSAISRNGTTGGYRWKYVS